MSANGRPSLTFHAIHPPEAATRGIRGRDARPARIQLFTAGGSGRTVPLTRKDLVKIIADAAAVLARLDRDEGLS